MSNLGRTDVERIVETVLSDLSIEVKDGDFTNPNSRTVILKYKNTELSRTWFDVVQKSEYEG
jgi:hypothetical protein